MESWQIIAIEARGNKLLDISYVWADFHTCQGLSFAYTIILSKYTFTKQIYY